MDSRSLRPDRAGCLTSVVLIMVIPMVSEQLKKKIQVIGGGLIIAVAMSLLIPGFITYIFSIWRIVSLIASIVCIAILIVYVYHRLKPSKGRDTEPQDNSDYQ